MKFRITYKELTLALGILVAIVVIITLWLSNPAEQQSSHTTYFPKITSPIASKSLIRLLAEVIM